MGGGASWFVWCLGTSAGGATLQTPTTRKRNATYEFILARLSPRPVMTSFCLPGVITLCIKTCPHGFDNAKGETANGK